MGILGNKPADVVAKRATEEVGSLEDHEKWMLRGGGKMAMGQIAEEGLSRGKGEGEDQWGLEMRGC